MGVLTQIVAIILPILLFVLIALFGHVPRLRNTPIGWFHRFIFYKIPRWLRRLDNVLTGGCIFFSTKRCGTYLLEDKHPLIVVFYLTLVTGGLYLFIQDGWKYLSPIHKFFVIIVSSLPYITLYMAVYSDPGIITTDNLDNALRMYPYDNIIFYPKMVCRTCHFVKPARSKHCSTCKHCVAKHDHHCVWINNCVGHSNTRHFLAFLMATNLLLCYGAYLTASIMHTYLSQTYLRGRPVSILPWRTYLRLWGIGILEETLIGAIFLLCSMCLILSASFTSYHLYLIWAGTTTNETFKWSDWKDDIRYDVIHIADDDVPDLPYTYRVPPPPSPHLPLQEMNHNFDEQAGVNWPIQKRQHLARLMQGQTIEDLPKELRWRKVKSLTELENIYDLGWKKNLAGVLFPEPLNGLNKSR